MRFFEVLERGHYWPAGDYQPNNHIEIHAEHTITAAGSNSFLVIHDGADFTFQAEDVITAFAGFSVEPNAEFSAILAPCTPLRIQEEEDEYEYKNDDIIDSAQIINASIAPNPSTGKFTIQLGEEDDLQNKNYHLEIYNTLGERVFQSAISNPQSAIDLSNKSKGIYFIKIQSGDPDKNGAGKIYTEKVVIQ